MRLRVVDRSRHLLSSPLLPSPSFHPDATPTTPPRRLTRSGHRRSCPHVPTPSPRSFFPLQLTPPFVLPLKLTALNSTISATATTTTPHLAVATASLPPSSTFTAVLATATGFNNATAKALASSLPGYTYNLTIEVRLSPCLGRAVTPRDASSRAPLFSSSVLVAFSPPHSRSTELFNS